MSMRNKLDTSIKNCVLLSGCPTMDIVTVHCGHCVNVKDPRQISSHLRTEMAVLKITDSLFLFAHLVTINLTN